jgi:hypothetical protein
MTLRICLCTRADVGYFSDYVSGLKKRYVMNVLYYVIGLQLRKINSGWNQFHLNSDVGFKSRKY